jgi:hypothetical protein
MRMAITAGTYRGRGVEGSEQYGATKNGADQVVVDLQLETGEVVSTFLYFSEAAAPHSVKRLRALGWAGDDLADLRGIGTQDVDVRISYEEFNGKQQMRVEIVTGGTVTLKDPLDARGKKQFAQRFANLVKSVKAEPPKTKNGKAPPQRESGDDDIGSDEVPF